MKILSICLTSIIIAVFVFGLACSKGDREIKPEQLQKRGDGLFYAVNEEKPYSGKVIELYQSGQKKAEINYENGAIDGAYRIWSYNGQQEAEGTYKDGKEDGQWISWHVNGQKARQGRYKDGKREGRWDFWTQDGQKFEADVIKDIDGNTYLTIKIGDQWWMAENLKVTHYRTGDAIPHVTDNNAWWNLSTGAYCRYGNDAAKAETFGNLYNWYAVDDSRNIAPAGWHMPVVLEWKKLFDHLGGLSVAGGKMKETARWSNPNTGATNECGFSALPGGYRGTNGVFGLFSSGGGSSRAGVGKRASFWSSTCSDRIGAWGFLLFHTYSGVDPGGGGGSKQCGFSVRCVRD